MTMPLNSLRSIKSVRYYLLLLKSRQSSLSLRDASKWTGWNILIFENSSNETTSSELDEVIMLGVDNGSDG